MTATTFLAGMSEVDSGHCPPTPLPANNVLKYFGLDGTENPTDDLKHRAISDFLATAKVGEWKQFEDLGWLRNKTLTLVAVSSDNPAQ